MYKLQTVLNQWKEEHAAAMADRFRRLFLRALRALRDTRRSIPVIVQNAGQVNMAERQVNLSSGEAKS
jgi:hypothetical protein